MATGTIKNTNATTETIATGVTMLRDRNVRTMTLVSYALGQNGFTVPSGDRPQSAVDALLLRRDTNGRSAAIGFIEVSTSGTVSLYYAGTYNASGSGLSNITTSDRVWAQISWSV